MKGIAWWASKEQVETNYEKEMKQMCNAKKSSVMDRHVNNCNNITSVESYKNKMRAKSYIKINLKGEYIKQRLWILSWHRIWQRCEEGLSTLVLRVDKSDEKMPEIFNGQ